MTKERPILFNGAMVRAILAGRKTQTRRLCKDMNAWVDQSCREVRHVDGAPHHFLIGAQAPIEKLRCPYGQPGDRLWVREAHAIFPAHGQHRGDGKRWGPWGGLPTTVSEDGKLIAYYRDGFDRCNPGRWRPSIHMPRWACRLVLEITDVRVERLQAISKGDCMAEGPDAPVAAHLERAWHVQFQRLWESTGGDWAGNRWVWAITFKRIEA